MRPGAGERGAPAAQPVVRAPCGKRRQGGQPPLSALAAGLTTGIAAGLTLTSARAQETGDPNAIADAGTERGTETAMLPTVTVEASGTVGFFSEPVAQTAGSVMRTDTPIVETPLGQRGDAAADAGARARNVTQALQYIPGVVAGTYGLDNRSDWAKVSAASSPRRP